METCRRFNIGTDTIIMILLTLASLELNVPFVLDQLDYHHAMPLMGRFSAVLCPGGPDNPLVILNNQFVPFKLLIRTLSMAIILIWCATDAVKFGNRHRLRSGLAGLLITLHIVLPMGMLIRARLAAENHALAHDGGTIQMEESMKMLLMGKNPYSEDFIGTPLENWRGFSNNVVYHVPYMPGSFLYSIPFYLPTLRLIGCYDQRFLHLVLFFLSLTLIGMITPNESSRTVARLAFALNPFFAKYFMLGTNDIVVLFWLLLAVTLIVRGSNTAGMMALAAACAIKQFAWFFVPFLAVPAIGLSPEHPRQWFAAITASWRRWLPGAVLFLGTVLPFMLWDFSSFIDDTIRYGSGGLPTSYPMQGFHGYGFATIPLFFRWVRDGSAMFPFTLLQVVVVIPWFLWLWRRYASDKSVAGAVTFSALTLLPFMFLSRYLHANFVGFIIFWPILGWCMRNPEDHS